MFFVILAIVIFAALVYYAERSQQNQHNQFSSIGVGLWWSLITISTVGFGGIFFFIYLSLLWYVLLLLLTKNSNFDATGKRYSRVYRYGSENVSWNGCWLSLCVDGRPDDRITCSSHRVEFFEFILPRAGQSKIAEETKESFAGNLLKINIFIWECDRNFSPEIWMICVCNHFLASRNILIIETSVH